MAKVFLMDLWCEVTFYNAYLCQALSKNGVECQLGSISFHLEPEYFDRRGLKTDPGAGDLISRLRIRNARLRQALKFIEFCANLAALAWRFRSAPPQIMHIQWLPLAERGFPIELWFLRFAKRKGIKLVYTVHNVLPHDCGPNLMGRFKAIYKMMDHLVCHTWRAREELIKDFGVSEQKISVVPHGPLFYDHQRLDRAEARQRLGLAQDKFVVLYQGYVRPYKGIEFLLDAWKRVQLGCSNATLLIAGRGQEKYMQQIRDKVESLGLSQSVNLHLRYVPSEELPLYYQAADVAVYPHNEITQSGSLMTGIAFGKTIVATDLAGFREALRDYGDVVFVRHGDVPQLSEALLSLSARAQMRGASGNPSSFSDSQKIWAEIGEKTSACYRELLAGGNVSPGNMTEAALEMCRSNE